MVIESTMEADMALIAIAQEGRNVWINPNLVRSVQQNGMHVVIHFAENDMQLLAGDAADVVAKLNLGMERYGA